MALDKDILGQALYDDLSFFNNKNKDEIGDIETARLNFCKQMAETIINHFKENILLTIPGTGLVAPSGGGPVTGASITGTIE
jgi:hypothetical protein